MLCWLAMLGGQETEPLARQLAKVDATILSAEQVKQANQAIWRSIHARRDHVHALDRQAWEKIATLEDWTAFRDRRLTALRRSLGQFPPAPKNMAIHVTRTIQGEGFLIDNMLFESRPGWWVTANLYRPAIAHPKMPGLLIIPSHHNPKTQGELQDMGMTWAREGCFVLVPDLLGHGERRQHPFVDAASFPGPFKVGRQDYYFRYNTGVQLHVIGDSLIGWMVWDAMRGLDVLLRQPGVDPDKIMVLGSVAGGGDLAAVTAALDQRVKAAVVFNFGGPQPETKYPLPANAETTFNYLGGGGWESTRNLRLSGRDGFLPWLIVGGIAPRGLIHAHEFAWDQERDPVWKRLETIFGYYQARDLLRSVHGQGNVRDSGPGNTHCNNIGPEHRQGIYPALRDWLGMTIPKKEYRQRLLASELRCWTPAWEKQLQPKSLVDLAGKLGQERSARQRLRVEILSPQEARAWLREGLSGLLGKSAPREVTKKDLPGPKVAGLETLAAVFTMADPVPVQVPVLYLIPPGKKLEESPWVIGLAQEGKQGFLRHRAEAIAALLKAGLVVCLPDLRGCGETAMQGDGRGRTSVSTAISSSEWMLGSSLLNQRLLDLLAILPGNHPVALWGDSFAPVNVPDRRVEVPLDAEKMPHQSEPLGGLLALLGGLYCPGVKAVHVRGGLVSYQSILESPFLYVPHDVIIPGLLTVGDLDDVAAALAPRPLRLEALVDGRNRLVSSQRLRQEYPLTRIAYQGGGFSMGSEAANAETMAAWFAAQCK